MILISSRLLGEICGYGCKEDANPKAVELAETGKGVRICLSGDSNPEVVYEMARYFQAESVVVKVKNGVSAHLEKNGIRIYTEADLEDREVWNQLNCE